MADTGNGATLSFGETSGSYDIISISGLEVSRDVIEITKLSDTGHKRFIRDDLCEVGEVTVTAYGTSGVPSITTAYTGTALDEAVTITYPIAVGDTGGATVVFGGVITSVKTADAEMGEVMVVEFTIKGTGNTSGFTFTAGT